ncbi:phosphoribosyltransferase family protein [Lysinibacillus louembei]|uniref:Phosphoribosyltransferase family protein n=1 Tax=Lysinibacillus louembei TaxID=1470088 RepID=A0ABZ0RW92_9BACI|nr:phosphoribosyltransferase family protein [Lysinibacillus louembei]WPK12420.1 phosphoribosyltransferase family protein [Lysinibacillus louembei]
MDKEVHNCLLCERELQHVITWKTLFERSWPPVICERCEEKFERAHYEKDGIIALYQYNDMMKQFLHQYKFSQDIVLAKVFRQKLYECLSHRQETIVPIPMHPLKKKERTFAHIDELLHAAEIPFQHLLEKTTIETQVGKSKQQRQQVAPLFTCNKELEMNHYILIDDILTTGTTIAHAKKALLDAGAQSVSAIVLIKG